MPLTRRQNGNNPSNIIQASWFNDFLDLLTGYMPDQPVTINNTLTANALSTDNGKISTDGNGNLILNGGGDTGLHLNTANGSTPSWIQVGVAFGIKNHDNKRLLEVKNNGNLLISGSQYASAASNYSTASGQSFDGFDLAEIYQCDANYENGTVVCPHETKDVMTRCTHENCPCACVISLTPAFIAGNFDPDNFLLPISLVGRVNVKTLEPITKRMLVVSDGKGGVRPIHTLETGYVIGIALNDAKDGQVGILLRPMIFTRALFGESKP